MKLPCPHRKDVIVLFLIALLASLSATFLTYRFTPYGCTSVKTLLQQKRVNMNEDGYSYTVEIQGHYNLVHYCGDMRAWLRVDIPPLPKYPLKDSLAVMQLSLWEGDRNVASIPPTILTYPRKAQGYSITVATPWGKTACAWLQSVNNTGWSSGIFMTDGVCG